jgi:ABC-2 type transport system ATP-binding protein
MKPVLELDSLDVRLGRRLILKQLSMKLSGRSIGLLGPNGAGKSTLISTLLGFYKPSAGRALIFGQDVQRHSLDLRGTIGYMPENESFIAGMTAVRYVRMMAELSGLQPKEALERAHESLFYVGLGEARYRPLETYSQGMKQLAKLAQAIVHGPRLLFLDEPTNALDPPHRLRMLKLIQEIRDSGKVNLLISSHLLRDVDETCDEVLILRDGKIAATCDLEAERQANRRFLHMEVTGDRTAFLDGLHGLGCETASVPRRKDDVRTVLPDKVEISDLFRLALAHGAQIRRLAPQRDSLEDIFDRAMENS